jgi:GNAT superfamily N-acetyltransferase
VAVQRLTPDELARISEIDVTESGDLIYEQSGEHLFVRHEHWKRHPRDARHWQPFVEEWRAMLARGGVALGVFDGAALAGLAVLRYELAPGMAQLAALFVDRAHRRHGVASALVDEVVRLARESGARELYVSATPSASAVGFYLRHGFRPTVRINPELHALEPEDIHMIRPLTPAAPDLTT